VGHVPPLRNHALRGSKTHLLLLVATRFMTP
jgi:hypothetical protein